MKPNLNPLDPPFSKGEVVVKRSLTPLWKRDFLWSCQASQFSGCLADLLSSDVGQVVVFVIGLMVSPHHKNKFEPLCSQSSECLMLVVPFGSLISIVLFCPFTSTERVKRKPVHGMAQMLVTGESKLDHAAFATGLSDRDRSRLGLKMSERSPATLSIAQLGPNRR